MAQSYTNLGGSGYRQGMFNIRSTLHEDVTSTPQLHRLLDGSTASNAVRLLTGSVSGREIVFVSNIGARVITGFKLYFNGGVSGTTFDFQAWNGTSWVTLDAAFTVNASSITRTFTNSTAYSIYRIVGVSGTTTAQSWYQIEFLVDDSGTATGYEKGNRASVITCTTNLTIGSGSAAKLVDGNYTSTEFGPSQNQTLSGKYIRFQFSAAVQLNAAFWSLISEVSNPDQNGTWKWQGSNDGTTWTDVTTEFGWYDGVDNGFMPIQSTTTYSYYQLLGISGVWLSTAISYREVHFSLVTGGTIVRNDRFTGFLIEPADTGPGSNVRTTLVALDIANTGDGSIARISTYFAEVIYTVAESSDIGEPTNVGAYDNIDEFAGDGPPDPVALALDLVDEGELSGVLNTNVATPFIAHISDNSELFGVLTLPLQLVCHLEDSSFIILYSADLTPIPVVQTVIIATGR